MLISIARRTIESVRARHTIATLPRSPVVAGACRSERRCVKSLLTRICASRPRGSRGSDERGSQGAPRRGWMRRRLPRVGLAVTTRTEWRVGGAARHRRLLSGDVGNTARLPLLPGREVQRLKGQTRCTLPGLSTRRTHLCRSEIPEMQ